MPEVLASFLSWLTMGAPAFLFVITVVVFFHELGHFAMARFFGVKIETFSVGFGRELFGRTDRHGTRWKLSLLPLGGYVKFAGDADVSSRPDAADMEKMDPVARAQTLHFKPLYQRALVAAAGPLANFLLAILIFAALFMSMGKPASPPIVELITQGSAAERAGLLQGDVIRSVNGLEVETFAQLQRIVSENANRAITLGLQRDGEMMSLKATPEPVSVKGVDGTERSIGRLGITDAIVAVGPSEALTSAVVQTWAIVSGTMVYLGQLISGQADADQLSGPIGIAKISGDVAATGLLSLINLTAFLSVSIGLLNLFPIPVLDGGHLLYYAFEAVLGRPLGERAQEVGFRLGLALVLCLMLFATFNDLVRFNLF